MPAAPPPASSQRTLVLSCFFLSGAAGLIYQVAWAKSLALIFGSTVYAVTTVLAVFLGGLTLGSDWIGLWSERREDPILFYAQLELGVAALGVVSLASLAGVRALYVHAFLWIGDSRALRGGLRFLATAIVLLPPTFLMGGTLPVLVRGLGSQALTLRARVSRLYWVNTFGAVVGALAAGFWLLPIVGGRLTVLTAAALNLFAGIVVLRMRREKAAPPKAKPKRAKALEAVASRKLLLAAFAIVGATAMAYEIAWTRLLAIMFGNSTYAFTVMLGTFLAGIALGSALFEMWAKRRTASLRGFEVTQTLTASAGLLFLFLLPHLSEVVVGILRATGNSFRGLLLAQAIASGLAMLPATIVFGFNFPLVVSLLAESRGEFSGESAAVGRAYAANTAGAIVGAMLAGFWLLPWVGGFRLVAIAASANLLLAFALAAGRKLTWAPLGVKLAVAAGLVAIVTSSAFYNRALATFGAALYYPLHAKGVSLEEMAETNDVLFAADGPNATVAVIQSEDYLALRIDGKVDASNLDTRTQLLLGHLPAFFHPHPRRVLVIGFGSGMTLAAFARYSEIERLDCAEIEPRVIRAAGYLEKLNGGVLQDPRVHIILDDARNFLTTTRERYDVISSEPSNPWVAGVANLYTSEFYREAAARLAPGGLFVQWVQGYSLESSDLRMVIRTFASEFPLVTLWRGESKDYLLLGQVEMTPLSLDRLRAVWKQPQLQEDFRKLGLDRPEGLLAYHKLDNSDLRRFAEGVPWNTDDLTLLEFRAPRSLFAEDLANKNRSSIWSFRSNVLPTDVASIGPPDLAWLSAAETSLTLGDAAAAKHFMKPFEIRGVLTPDVELMNGRIELSEQNFEAATDSFRVARQLDPQSLEIEATLARAMLGSGDSGDAERLLSHVLAVDPKQKDAIDGMLELNTMKKDWREAARWQAERIELDPTLGCREYVRLGRDYLRAGDEADGLRWLGKALERDSYCHPAHRTMAEHAIAKRNWAEAKAHLESLERYGPDEDPSVYSSLAGVELALGDKDASREVLRKGLRIFPGDATLLRLTTVKFNNTD